MQEAELVREFVMYRNKHDTMIRFNILQFCIVADVSSVRSTLRVTNVQFSSAGCNLFYAHWTPREFGLPVIVD